MNKNNQRLVDKAAFLAGEPPEHGKWIWNDLPLETQNMIRVMVGQEPAKRRVTFNRMPRARSTSAKMSVHTFQQRVDIFKP